MLKAFRLLGVAATLFLLVIACSHGKARDIAARLAEALSEALEIDNGSRNDGAPPPSDNDPGAPVIKATESSEFRLGAPFVITVYSDYPGSDIDKIILYIDKAKSHFIVSGQLIKGRMDITGLLEADDSLRGKTFGFKLALGTSKGLVGPYWSYDHQILDLDPSPAGTGIMAINADGENSHDSGRPKGSTDAAAPQITGIDGPGRLAAGSALAITLTTSYATNARKAAASAIDAVILTTPANTAYKEIPATAQNGVVTLHASLAGNLHVGDWYVFLLALRAGNTVGGYRPYLVRIVEETDGDTDRELEADSDSDAEPDIAPDGDTDGDTDTDLEPELDTEQEEADDDKEEPATLSLEFVPGDGHFVTDGAWVNTNEVDVKLSSNAGEGRSVTLNVDGKDTGTPVALDAQGFAVFRAVTIFTTKSTLIHIKAGVQNASGESKSAEIAIRRDRQAPLINVTLLGTSPLNSSENIGVELAVTEESLADMLSPKAQLELFDMGTDPGASLGTAEVAIDSAGAGHYTYPFIANGSYKVVATLTDKAGNSGTGDTSFAVATSCYDVQVTSPAAGRVYGRADALGGDTTQGVCVPIAIATNAPDGTSTAAIFVDDGTTPAATCTIVGGGCSFGDTTCGAAGVNFKEGAHRFQVKVTNGTTSCGSNAWPLSVDFTNPEFVSFTPAPGLLNRSNDSDDTTPGVFDLKLQVQVLGATIGQPLEVTVVGDTTTAPTVTSTAVTAIDGELGQATLSGQFVNEDGYTFYITARDLGGNISSSGALYYTLKFKAETHLLSWDGTRLDGSSALWTYADDLDPLDPGYTTHLKAQTLGFETGAVISLCSDKTLQDGSSMGPCTSDASFYIVAKSQVGTGGLVSFASVDLANETTHTLFVEGTDSANNHVSSLDFGAFILTLDSLRPALAPNGLVIQENVVANDKSDRLVLGAKEGAASASALTVNVNLTLGAGITDGRDADLFLNGSSLTGNRPVPISTVGGVGHASFTAIALPNGSYSGANALLARLWDKSGNASDDANATSHVNIEVDTVAPKVSFVDLPGRTFYQAQCSRTDALGNCLATVQLRVEKQAGETSSLVGGIVTLSLGSTTRQIALNADADSQLIDFTDFPIPQGTQSLGALASDPAGNESLASLEVFVDSSAPTLEIVTPATDPTYLAADNDDTQCGDGSGLSDLKLRRCDWTVAFTSAVTYDTSVLLQWRYQGESDWRSFGPDNAGASWVAPSGSTTHAIGALDFTRDANPSVVELRLTSVEGTTGNTWQSPVLRSVTLNFAPSFSLLLYAVSNGGAETPLADGLALNAGYSDSATDDDTFTAHIVAHASSELNGKDLELSVDDAGFASPTSCLISSGVAACAGALQSLEMTDGMRHTFYARVVVSTSETVRATASNVLTDSKPPHLSFKVPLSGSIVTYNFSMDNDGTGGNGILPKASYAPQLIASDIEDGQVATLSAKDGEGNAVSLGGTTTASFTGGVAIFSAVRLPNTGQLGGGILTLSASANDLAGNGSVLINGQPQLAVDDDPPKDVSDLVACIGASTGTDAIELEPSVCSPACGGDTNKCDRRSGTVLLTWTAPASDSTGGSGTVPSSYEIRWLNKPSDSAPCSGVDFATATSDPATASAFVTTPYAVVGGRQTAVVRGLDLNTNYCFWVRASDEAGNKAQTNFAAAASTAKVQRKVGTSLAVLETGLSGISGFANMLRMGDLNGDGFADLVVSDWQANGNRGRVYIYYGQESFPAAPTVADAGWANHGLRLEGEAAGDTFGTSFAIGDINGDGYDDLVVGAPGADPTTDFYGEGRVYVYFGSTGSISSTASLVFKPTPNQGGGWGQSLGQAVEILDFDGNTLGTNGHNCKALAISTFMTTEGAIYLLRGRADWSSLGATHGYIQAQTDLTITRATDYTPNGDVFIEMNGHFLAKGDFNGDGIQDLLISQIDYDGANDRAWMVPGGYSGSTLVLGADSASTKLDSPTGTPASDWGYQLFGLPSSLGGGRSEAMILDYGSGTFYYYRDLAQAASALFPPPTAIVDPDRPWVGTAGDFNGDGKNDAVLSYRSEVALYWGASMGLSLSSKTKLYGFDNGNYKAVGGGDMNGDGRPDLALVNTSTGAVYIVY